MKYEFVCSNCDVDVTEEASINEPKPQPFCQRCGYRMTPVWGSPTINLKGSGWGKDNQ